jgi:hypothetical protein
VTRRRLRWVAWYYAALMAVVVLVLAAKAEAMTVPQLVDRSEAWVSARVGEPVPDRPFVADAALLDEVCQPGRTLHPSAAGNCGAVADADVVTFRPWVIRELARMGRTRGDWWLAPGVAALVVHEQLHVPGRDRARLDEGVVEALAIDLAPAWARQVAGIRLPYLPAPGYAAEVNVVRKASARATGGSWRSRAARHWRLDLWRLDSDERDRLVREALA